MTRIAKLQNINNIRTAMLYTAKVTFIRETSDAYIFSLSTKYAHKYIITDFSCDVLYTTKWFEGSLEGMSLEDVKGITSATRLQRVIR